MNKICLIGRLTKDVELKATPSGKEIASFNLAVQRNYKNAEGEYEADFISCKAFEKKAEIISKFFKKGSQIGIEGHIQTGSYTKDDGTTVYTTDVIVDGLEFIGNKYDKQTEKNEEISVNVNKNRYTAEEVDSVEIPNDPFAEEEQMEINDMDLPF